MDIIIYGAIIFYGIVLIVLPFKVFEIAETLKDIRSCIDKNKDKCIDKNSKKA